MSIPEPTQAFSAPAGWYPTGETGSDGLPVERWWDGAQWTATVRPLTGGAGGPGGTRGSRAKSLIAAAVVVVVVVGGGLGTYFALHKSSTSAPTSANAQSTPSAGPTPDSGNGGGGNGSGGSGGLGNGGTGGLGSGGLGGATASPQPTVAGGSGQTVTDPIDDLTIPVPSGWTGISGSATGQGSWPEVTTGPYTCPSALAQANGNSGGSAAQDCTSGGVSFNTAPGTDAQSLTTADMPTLAKDDYGTLTSHSVVSQGAVTVAGRAGYQITWSVVPDYTGPSGTVEVIALPVPGQTGYFTLIDIGVDQSAQAPSLSSVNSLIITNITDSSASGA